MKTISIGDIHGRLDWKEIDPKDYNKIIFMGDYIDSFIISDEQIENNLLDIIQFKKDNIDKVILLWGNHDLQYLFSYDKHGCSGYRPQMYESLHKIFTDNKDLFQMAYQYDNTLWTHAGIHAGWWKYHFKKYHTMKGNISDKLNKAFNDGYHSLFNISYIRGGYHSEGGPFWCDKSELSTNPYRKINQIVGHSKVDYIKRINIFNINITYIDVLKSKVVDTKFYIKEFNEN